MTRLRSPIMWYGGKGMMTAKLLPLIPEHHTYCEVFCGGASLFFAKKPAPVEVINDLHSGLVNMYRVIRDESKFEQFHRMVALTPYSREEFRTCRDTWEQTEDGVERAWKWYVMARQWFGGGRAKKSTWSFKRTHSNKGMASSCSKWLSTIEALPAIHERLSMAQIEHDDWRVVLDNYDSAGTFFYLDPPYVPDSRQSKSVYTHEMTNTDHEELVERILRLEGMVLLSGYAHNIYAPLESAGWRRQDWQTSCYATARTRGTGILGKGSAMLHQPRMESVWRNYELPQDRQGVLFGADIGEEE